MLEKGIKIEYFGHALFRLTAPSGVRVATDPYNEWVIPKPPVVDADVVTVSHSHADHNNISAVRGYKKVISTRGEHVYEDIKFKGIETKHDASGGRERGNNLIFKIYIDGITFAHCGDLGHLLGPAESEELKDVNILLIPVGGTFTIDHLQAKQLVESLSPNVAIPMHFKFTGSSLPVSSAEPFLKLWPAYQRKPNPLQLSELPKGVEIWYLEPNPSL